MPFFDAIYQAAKNRDERALSLILIQPDANIDEKQSPGLTPAAKCAMEGDIESAKWLMDKFNADRSQLYYGVALGKHIEEVMAQETTQPATSDFELVEAMDRHIFMLAGILTGLAQLGDRETIQTVLSNQNDLLQDSCNESVIEGAAYGGHAALFEEYLEKHLKFLKEEDPSDSDRRGRVIKQQAAEWLAYAGREELLFKLLKDACPDDDYICHDAIKGAIKGNQRPLFEKLSAEVELNRVIVCAASAGNIELTHELLVDNFPNQSAICEAAYHHHYSLLTSLLDRYHNEDDYFSVAEGMHRSGSLWSFDLVEFLSNMQGRHLEKIIDALIKFNERRFSATKDNAYKFIHNNLLEAAPEAREVVELKEKYGLMPSQAHAFCESGVLLRAILDHDNQVSSLSKLICNRLGQKKFNGRRINEFVIEDLITRVRDNAPRAHDDKDATEFKQLVTSPHALFTSGVDKQNISVKLLNEDLSIRAFP